VSGAPPGSADREFMQQALALALLGEGATSPNPRVGCVLVRDGRVVGTGFHRAAGEPHAEAIAVSEAGDRAKGSTAYVNLEPCSHEGRTPPCADLLVRSGVRRVVACHRDSNPLVDRRGFERLREAGVAVEVGLLEEDARRINASFLARHATGRPLVTLKAAVSQDGMIAALGGRSRWITGPAARRVAHRLRYRHDAVLVGAATVRRDAPRLTVRLPGVVADRLRVVLSPRLEIDAGGSPFGDIPGCGPPRVYVGESLPEGAEAPFAGRADVVRVPMPRLGRLDLGAVLEDLARLDVMSVLVEGGARTFAGFLDAGLVDRVALFVSPRLLGARGGTPLLDLGSATDPAAGWKVIVDDRVAIGEDVLVQGRVSRETGRG
jgi:diaminohydroxyphosphoribosylaminopyrimidine deaminase / 5-amino-6-(5-phosphoribosylamino)uracil reductase